MSWTKQLGSKTEIVYDIKDIRREKTGLHGMLGISNGTGPLGFTECNIKRDGDRRELARWSHKRLTQLDQAAYPIEDMYTDLDRVCLWTIANWETRTVEVGQFDPDAKIEPLQPLLDPYIYDGTGTIMFAPPGAGKSYIMQLMAVCLSMGLETPWKCVPSPVLYVSLERSRRSLELREQAIRRALGIEGRSHVEYIHARGRALRSLAPQMRQRANDTPGLVTFLDSVTRAGLGKMVEDSTANSFIDEMNALPCWFAVGHTPKYDSSVLYGNIGYTAGEDIGIRLQGETRDHILGVKLEMVKANDVAFSKPEYLALEFAEDRSGLQVIRRANGKEFPELSLSTEELIDGVLLYGKASPVEISKETGVPTSTVDRHLKKNSKKYMVVDTVGRQIFYGIRAQKS